MKNKRLLITILLTVSTLALTACGNTANTVSAEETTKNQVVENVTTAESETAVKESVITETTETVIESETASEEKETDPNFNGAGHKGTLEETQQTYITYTDLDPVTMYVISNTTGEQYSTYHDINVTEGELVVSSLVEPNQELQIDGKGTYNNTEYYRIVFQEEMMLNHQIIIPADLVTSEKQEVQQQQPEVQQPEVQQPEQTPPPASENNTPEWTPDTGVSKEDWDAFFGGGNTTGQHTWTPDHSDPNYNVSVNEKGGFTITGSGIDQELLEESSKYTWE